MSQWHPGDELPHPGHPREGGDPGQARAILKEMRDRQRETGFLNDWWAQKLEQLAAALSPSPVADGAPPVELDPVLNAEKN